MGWLLVLGRDTGVGGFSAGQTVLCREATFAGMLNSNPWRPGGRGRLRAGDLSLLVSAEPRV